MTLLAPILGVTLLTLAAVDLLWTTAFLRGAGPLTRSIGRAVDAMARRGGPTRRSLAGGLALLLPIGAWVLLLWVGWVLVFAGFPGGVVAATGGEPVSAVGLVYFTGYCLFTLGLGDVVPEGAFPRLLTTLTAFSGLFAITLAITYMTGVLGSAVAARTLAAVLRRLGTSPSDVLARHRDGSGYERLTSRLDSVVWPLLERHVQRHLAYPILHHFQTRQPEHSLAVGLARLDESLRLAAREEGGRRLSRPVEEAIGELLDRLEGSFFGDEAATTGAAGDAEEARRERLRRFVSNSGAAWADVEGGRG